MKCFTVIFDLSMYNSYMNINELSKYENMWVAYTVDRKKIVEKANSLDALLKKIGLDHDYVVSFLPSATTTISP